MRKISLAGYFCPKSLIFKQILRTMKITLFLLLFVTLQAYSADSYSQNAKISIESGAIQVGQLLSQIESQTDYLFVYNKKNIDLKRIVNVNANNEAVAEILNKVFKGTGVSYVMEGKNIVLTKAKETATAIAQQAKSTIKGKVVDPQGEPVIGANVVVSGTTDGTITDLEGNFNFNGNPNGTLLVSFVGYKTQSIPMNGKTTFNIKLEDEAMLLDNVVVTALGIEKKEKSLTYSTQIVDGKELIRAKDPNMINSLAGKTAGVQISRSASGLGGSVKMSIRGNRSVNGDNQPLYVIDGVPINSSSNDQTATTIGGNNDGGNRDGGDGISNLNPDDIESMNILKGPAAAALYGSSAANGVVVITTKKGKVGRTNVSFSTNTTWESAAYGIPEFQNDYKGTATDSWGAKGTGVAPNYDAKDFFKTGMTTINSVSLSSGSEALQTYFSYANTYGKGIIEHSSLNKHNFNFRETANFFDKKLIMDANVNLMYQDVRNRPTPGGFYMNPLVGLYKFPRGGTEDGHDLSYYRDNYKVFNAQRNMYLQNWYKSLNGGWDQNPYWLTNMLPSSDRRYRTIANLSATYKINKLFTIQVRGNADFVADNYEQKMYAGTDPALTTKENGRYTVSQSNDLNIYGDALFTYQQTFKNFAVNATIGASLKDLSGRNIGIDSYGGGLYNPNIFAIRNIDLNSGAPSLGKYHTQDQAVFFAGQLGFRDWLFLDVTARNDWTSSLAYTKYNDKGFFYPSAGLTWVINESLKLPEWINLGKLRGAWSKVGNGLPRYISNPLNSVGKGGNISYNTTAPFGELKPEMTTSIEFGTEWRFFNSRLEFDFTYYKTNTKNQLFEMSAPSGSKYTSYYVNAGNIQNQGIEIVLGATPVYTKDFRWKTSVNYSMNKNKVKELAEGLGYFNFGGGGSNSYGMRLEIGGSFGDFYGYKFLRDETGNYVTDDQGLPKIDTEDLQKLGNSTPKWNLGWQNTFTYKGFSLYFLIDGRFGGEVLSLTEAELDKYGVSKRTGDARNNGGVDFAGKKVDTQEYYNLVGGRDGITENYVYSATNIRLRELSLGYSLPQKVLTKVPFIKGADISFIARNLFFFKNNAPYDTDAALSVGNGLQGVDAFGMPSTRSFGFNIKFNF